MAGAASDLRFDLVVATVDRTAPLEDLLRSLAAQTHRSFRLVVVDQNADDRVGNTHVSIADLKMWLGWLDTMDPLSARMIDLHYFAGLSFKETAEVLDLPPQAILRDLRFAKAWLMLRLEPAE